MKPQDILFFVFFGLLLAARIPRLFIFAGLICLALSMPLFAGWVFFTAQRLTWYAAAFFGVYVFIELIVKRKVGG